MLQTRQFRALSRRLGLDRDWYLVLLAVTIGLVMGVAALAFIIPITLMEERIEELSGAEDSNMTWVILLLPIAGALLTGVVFCILPLSLKGHGISLCMYSVSREKSRIPFRVLVRQWIGSTLTIGSGGSAGPEGPIVTIGATVGSSMGRVVRVDPQNTATLVGCGAAAGLASVFNAPMAGIFFVLEVILRDFSIRTFTPIVVAAVISAATTQTILGTNQPLFGVGPEIFQGTNEKFTVIEAPEFLVLGVACGLIAALFSYTLRVMESFFTRLRAPKILKPVTGALALVLIGIVWFALGSGSFDSGVNPELPPFYGNGYVLIKQLLQPTFLSTPEGISGMTLSILGGLIFLKIIATCLTLGSGGAGGLFAPSLLLGAMTGSLMGGILEAAGLLPNANPAQFALVGMAAVVAATTHAPLTAMVLVYEVTQNYALILPLMLTAVIATIVARLVNRESIYTAELRALGVRMGTMSDLTLLRRMSVRDVPMIPPVLVHESESGQRLLELSERFSVNDFVVVDDDDHYLGLVTGNDLSQALIYREAIPLLQVGEIERKDLPTVELEETLDVVLDKFSAHEVQSLAVVTPQTGEVTGLISRTRLMREYQRELEKD
ncbi:MAG: hypothetical protein CMJ33_02970 [Phycisphaerae bacterium]|nr:hypothetical protein [Phycisphaerae bacterium]HAW96334.1 hypothetical protein [Phycisphaerales bacterium]